MAEYSVRNCDRCGKPFRSFHMTICQKCDEELTKEILIERGDVAPVRHGRWNEESPDCLDGDSVYVCSICGETWTLIEGTPLDNNMHFCPNCGADMREVNNHSKT